MGGYIVINSTINLSLLYSSTISPLVETIPKCYNVTVETIPTIVVDIAPQKVKVRQCMFPIL